jgi:hypothetical protein
VLLQVVEIAGASVGDHMVDSLRKDSEYRSGLPCPHCGRSLLPVPTETTVTFHCKTGHELALLELVSAESLALKGGLETLLTEWRRHHQALIEIVENARKNGHLNVAEIVQRHATKLGGRIDKVQSAFGTTDTSKLMNLPDSMKSR